jgi:DNA-binding CsgD family transcriptional regulator
MKDMTILPARSPSLVGREGQFAQLRQAFEAACSGEPVTVLIGGEAGIGKTRLTEEFAGEVVAAGARAVVGYSVPLDGEGPAFAPIVGIVREIHAEFGTRKVLELAGPGSEALASLVPEIGAAPTAAVEGRGRLYEVVTSLLERVATEQPLVVILEDLQWADSPTRDLLRFLARSVRDARLLVLCTYRTDELHRGHPLRPLLAELDRLRQVRRVEVTRLGFDDVVVQLRDLVGHDVGRGRVERIYQRSEGIPFFVEELACVDDDSDSAQLLPGSLRDLLLVRVEPLTEDAQRLLRLMSAAGSRVDHAMLTEVSDKHTGQLELALREAVSAGVIVVDGDGYAFRHALLREAVHDDMLPGEHARMHARYALALEQHPELMPHTPIAVEVAHHWYSAHDVERAFAWSLTAADELVQAYAHGTAQQMLERALELWDQVAEPEKVAGCDRIDLLMRAANEAFDAGELERSLSLAKEALRLVDEQAEPARAGWVMAYVANVKERVGRPDAIELLMRARELIPAVPASAPRAEALDWLSTLLMLAWRCDEAMEAVDEAERVAAAASRPHIVASARITRGTVMFLQGHPEQAIAEMKRAESAVIAEPKNLLRYYVNLSDTYNQLGRYAEALDVATEGYDRAKELGRKRTAGSILTGNAVETMLAMGDWDRAERLLSRGFELSVPFNHERHMLCLRAWLSLWRGDVSAAAAIVTELHAGMARRRVLPQDSYLIARLAADVALARGKHDEAWGYVADVLREDAQMIVPSQALPLAFTGAQALGVQIRDSSTGVDVSEQVHWLQRLASIVPPGWPVSIWPSLIHAELVSQAGLDVDAWERALKRLNDSEGPVHLRPYARYRLALALVEAGDREAAGVILRQAAGETHELGAALYQGWIEDLARRAHISLGQTPPVASSPGLGLTAREHEVLRLVAEGRSNREIGEALFISSKTASVHVSNILSKLRVSGRGEAAALAYREGLFDSAAS